MEYKSLGASGLQVSTIGLGCNNFGMRIDKEKSAEVVNRALELGINFFDTADIYGGTLSEQFLGAALGERRQDVVVATKFGGPTGGGLGNRGGSRRYIMQAVEASLRRLNTDYIDLYQYHFPDVKTPIEESLRAMDDLVRSGKVRYIGSSNMSAWQTVEAHWVAKSEHLSPFITAQNEYSLIDRSAEQELAPACRPVRDRHSTLLPAGQRPPHRQVQSRRGTARGHAHSGLGRQGAGDPDGPQLRHRRGTAEVRRGTRQDAAGRRHQLARQPGRRLQRHRRRDEAGAGGAERSRSRPPPLAGGAGRDRHYHLRKGERVMARFQMRIDRVWAPVVLVGGATRDNSYVEVTPEAVTFNFGYAFNHTEDRDDIREVKARGWPWWMGIGWRSNLRGLVGLTGSYRNVVEVSFESRSRAWGFLPMNRIAVSVEDPAGFIAALKPPESAAPAPPAKPSARKKPARRNTRSNGSTAKRRTKRDTK